MADDGPRIRRAPIPDDASLVIRGDGGLEQTRRRAQLFRERYRGWQRWGVSAFYVRNDSEVDDLAQERLHPFPTLRLYDITVLHQAGLEVVPTFRTPHVTIAWSGDLDEGLRMLEVVRFEERENPYHGSVDT